VPTDAGVILSRQNRQHDREVKVASPRAWSGWIGFAGLMMMIIGAIDFFEGLIAVIRKEYYAFTPQGLIVFNVTTWGWLAMIFGIVLFLVGLGLTGGAGWARWVGIILIAVNLLGQLGWLGNSATPVWTLTVIALQIIVLYALTARWSDAGAV
jgi:hypothetical protein